MRTSSVCIVLFLRLLIWKPGWDQLAVTLIQVSSTADVTTRVSFVILVKAGSVGFVDDAVEHVGLSFVAKKAEIHD